MVQSTLEEQYPWLEGQREAKRQEYEARGEKKEEHEITREVFRDIAQGAIPTPPASLPSPTILDKKAEELKEKEHKVIVEELLQIALSKDLFAGMKLAERMHNPHIQDDFHAALAQQYEKLKASKKITP